MSDTEEGSYLSASELASLVDCKPNQRACMVAWLTANHWKFATGSSGLPKVARAYHDRKLGISESKKAQGQYADTPNLEAFAA